MKSLLLIDFANTLIRSLSVHKDLSYEGEWTGGMYGVFDQLVACIHKHNPTNILVCDDKKPYLREKLYPGFKGDRKRKTYGNEPEGFDWYHALQQNKDSTQELLEILDIPYWSIGGLEADDLIAFAVDKYHDDYDKIIILSNDTDLNQLLVYMNVFIYKKSKWVGPDRLYGEKEFDKEFVNLRVTDWALYTAMVGTHNGVPGIKGIGPKTALKILNDETAELYDVFMMKYERAMNEKLDLIELPLPGEDIPLNIPTPQSMTYNSRKVTRFLESKGIQFTTRMLQAIERF